MTITTAAVSRVSHHDALDVRLVITFTPSDPVGSTVVEIAGQEPPPARYLELVDAAAARLAVYADAYRQAVESDTERER